MPPDFRLEGFPRENFIQIIHRHPVGEPLRLEEPRAENLVSESYPSSLVKEIVPGLAELMPSDPKSRATMTTVSGMLSEKTRSQKMILNMIQHDLQTLVDNQEHQPQSQLQPIQTGPLVEYIHSYRSPHDGVRRPTVILRHKIPLTAMKQLFEWCLQSANNDYIVPLERFFPKALEQTRILEIGKACATFKLQEMMNVCRNTLQLLELCESEDSMLFSPKGPRLRKDPIHPGIFFVEELTLFELIDVPKKFIPTPANGPRSIGYNPNSTLYLEEEVQQPINTSKNRREPQPQSQSRDKRNYTSMHQQAGSTVNDAGEGYGGQNNVKRARRVNNDSEATYGYRGGLGNVQNLPMRTSHAPKNNPNQSNGSAQENTSSKPPAKVWYGYPPLRR